MKLELDFIPDVLCYFTRSSESHTMSKLWGDETIYNIASGYIHSLIKDHGFCLIAIQKGTLKYKIFDIEIKSEQETQS